MCRLIAVAFHIQDACILCFLFFLFPWTSVYWSVSDAVNVDFFVTFKKMPLAQKAEGTGAIWMSMMLVCSMHDVCVFQ